MAQIDYTQRVVVHEMLGMLDTNHVKLQHELYRLAHVYRDGLTEKECKFILQRCEVLNEEVRQIARLKARIKGTLDGRFKS